MKRVKEFLQKHWDGKSPLLLGYSGGPDSKALLLSLVEFFPFLHVAHVDHGWRAESFSEAKRIQEEIEALGLGFYTVRLNLPKEGNLEDLSRKARLSFFASLFEKIPFQALLLGHHADDLAETALKRVFEGAHLAHLGGMEKISSWDQMRVWRPLLGIGKKGIVAFLEELGTGAFSDPTNFDPTYLRSRFRSQTLPFLEENFGKNMRENLCVLSERSYELRTYLDGKIAHVPLQRYSWGVSFCCLGLERIERRHLLQKIALEQGICIPRTLLESVLDWISSREKIRRAFLQSKWIFSGRNSIAISENSDKSLIISAMKESKTI